MSTISQQQHKQPAISSGLAFFINLTRMHTTVIRRFDAMGSMVGFTDFILLYHLYQSSDHRLRRVDLADRLGLTASGVTRMLPPLEKIGLVGKESNPRDARVSFVTLTPAGKRILLETIERAEDTADTIVPAHNIRDMEKFLVLQEDIRRRALS